MKIKTTNFISPENERLTVFFVLNDDDSEIKRYSFYNEPRELNISPELETSISEFPDFLKMIYNSGLKNEEIEFITEDLTVS